jgi:hypothetical protein
VANLSINAVLFDVPAEICLDRRMNDPKNVFRDQVRDVDWSEVMKRMKMQMEPPEKSEGFDKVVVVDENGDVKEEF